MRTQRTGIPFTAPRVDIKAKRSPMMGVTARNMGCPTCKAQPGDECMTVDLVVPKKTGDHPARQRMARRERNRLRGIV